MKNTLFGFLFLVMGSNWFSAQKNDSFSDSTNFILAGQYKIDITQRNYKEYAVVYFKVYRKSKRSWSKIQDGSFNKDSNFTLNADTSEDLNNDGYLDLKISFAQAGRGSNSLEKLFIFDPNSQMLIDIKNSQDYPNLHYNNKRDCINSFSFSGGNTTYFLEIVEDRLEEFAHVYYDGEIVKSYKKIKGEDVLIHEKRHSTNDAAVFFSDFDPLEE